METTRNTGNYPKNVGEAATAVQQALHEVQVEIPSQEHQGQTGPDRPKKISIIQLTCI